MPCPQRDAAAVPVSETDYHSFEGETWLVPFRGVHKHHVSDVGSDAGPPAAFKSDP